LNSKITIIIPAYNAEKFLGRTVESVLAQTYKDWEMIIVNDGSRDSTWDIVQGYCKLDSRIRGLNQPNRGCSSARNAGIAASSNTPYIIFLDADDTWESVALETLHSALEGGTDFVAAHASCRYVDAHDDPIFDGLLEEDMRKRETYVNGRIVSIKEDEPTSFNSFVVVCCIRTPGIVLFRRQILERVNGFDTEFTHGEDWDLYIRCARHGNFKFVDRVILNYRLHGANATSQVKTNRDGMRKVFLKTLTSPENTAEQKKVARRCYSTAQGYFMLQKLGFAAESVQKLEVIESAAQFVYAVGHMRKMLQGHP
jgi:glycosyltransferase involved in cell wall biosynthesis